MEILKTDLAQIKFEIDCANSDWKTFPHSISDASHYLT